MKAKQIIYAVEIVCPACKETIYEPASGSVFWGIHEVPSMVECKTCQKFFDVSKRISH